MLLFLLLFHRISCMYVLIVVVGFVAAAKASFEYVFWKSNGLCRYGGTFAFEHYKNVCRHMPAKPTICQQVEHLPSPEQAATYKTSTIYTGPADSRIYQAMTGCHADNGVYGWGDANGADV